MVLKFLQGMVFLFAICAAGAARGQMAKSDTAFVQRAKAEAIAVYKQAFGRQSHLFNGPEYVEYRKPNFEGHPYFETDKLTAADVFYDGAWYSQVPVRYDVITDEVMTDNLGALQKLVPGKLHSFHLLGHNFVRYVKDSLSTSPLQTGYYDLLHHEAVIVLAKRAKNVQERVAGGKVTGEYQEIDRYYIGKDGTYYLVNSRSSLLNIFPAEKKQLRKHLQTKKINFNKNKEAAILEAAIFYDSLQE